MNELPRDKTNKMAYGPSEDSDQLGHPSSLIRVFTVRMKKAWVFSYPLSAQRKLGSLATHWVHSEDSNCPGWSESLLGAHVSLLVLSRCGSNIDQLWSKNTKFPFSPQVVFIDRFNWASSWDNGTYGIGDQRRLRRDCASAQSRQSLHCSLTRTMEVDKGSDQKSDI